MTVTQAADAEVRHRYRAVLGVSVECRRADNSAARYCA